MKVSTRCRYATLALFDIAFYGDGQAVQVRQIARRQGIPTRFLEQIFQELRRAHLVEGRRGRNGGYVLKLAPEQISLADIVHATDGPPDLGAPSDEENPELPAPSQDASMLVGQMWGELSTKVLELFEEISIGELVRRAEAQGIPRGDGEGYMYFI